MQDVRETKKDDDHDHDHDDGESSWKKRWSFFDDDDDDDDATMRKKTLSWGIFASAATTPTPTTTPSATNKKRKKKKGNGEQNATVSAASLNDKECREILEELDAQVVFIDSAHLGGVQTVRKRIETIESYRVRLRRRPIIENRKNHFVTNSYSGEDIPDRRDDGRWKGNLRRRRFERNYSIRGDFKTCLRRENGQRRFIPSTRRVTKKRFRFAIIRHCYSASGGDLSRVPSLRYQNCQSPVNQCRKILLCEDLKKRVKNMYTSIEDGDLWARRPLTDDARRYAALDAWILMKLNHAMRPNGTTASHLFPGFDESWSEAP